LLRFEEAVLAANEAIRLDRDQADSHSVRGRALLRLNRYEEALHAANEALRLDPDHAYGRTFKAFVEMCLRLLPPFSC